MLYISVFCNYTASVRIEQQSVERGVNMYFTILLFKNYYSGALYEIDELMCLLHIVLSTTNNASMHM